MLYILPDLAKNSPNGAKLKQPCDLIYSFQSSAITNANFVFPTSDTIANDFGGVPQPQERESNM